jgi:hypothetical protein
METKKWLTRAGSILILLGFFLPCVLVSCSVPGLSSAVPGASQSFSLSDLANDKTIGQGLLYLVPVMLVMVFVMSFLNFGSRQNASYMLWGQIGGLGASLLVIVIAAINLNAQVSKIYGLGSALGASVKDVFQVNPDYGVLVILIGYVVAGVGLFGQMSGSHVDYFSPAPAPVAAAPWGPPPPGLPDYSYNAPPPVYAPPSGGPRLEVIAGAPLEVFPLMGDNVAIGRGSECQIHLSEQSVSRMHARLRFAQGSWFIQDQGSSTGTIINGQPVPAGRLNPGDHIILGGVTLIFKV